jgi:hypothetical protein
MSKPPESIRCGDEIQSGSNGILKRFTCPGSLSAQHGFQFGERFLNGREIGRIGGQKQQATAASFNGRADPRRQVDREIIEHDDLPWAQTGGQDLFDIDLKRSAVSRSIQEKGRPMPESEIEAISVMMAP